MTPTISEQLQHLLGDRYRIEREIARGGMATVYLATDLRHSRTVALKVMHPDVALGLGRERFLREIQLAAGLSHPNILTVHDSGEAGDFLYYVMPYVEGETLRHRLDKHGSLSIDEAVRLAREAAEAIGYAHSLGIVHRDIKPENILFSRGHAVVADFGIARAIDAARDDRITKTGVALGTTAYMSPEQALGEDVDARSDVWALGCVLYEMLSGAPPFGSGGREVLTRALTSRPNLLRNTNAEISEGVEQIVNKALAREPADRFASATELADALDAYRTGPTATAAAPKRRVSRMAVVAGIAAVVLAAAVAVASRNESGAPAPPPSRTTPKTPRLSSDSVARELFRLGRAQQARRTAAGSARAISLYTQALARDSTFARAWAQLAQASYFAYSWAFPIPGIARDSLKTLGVNASERAVELDPDDPVSWLVKGRVARLVDPTDYGPPLFAVRKSLSIDSTNSDAWFDLGMIHQEILNDSAALSAWRHAAMLNPSDAQSLSFIGFHYLWTGDYARGVPWPDSAIRLDPTFLLARESAAQLALELHRPKDAQRHYEVGLRVTSGRQQATVLAMIGRAFLDQGDTATARAYLRRSKALFDPHHPTKHEAAWIGGALAAIGDTSGAVRLLKAYQPRGDLHFQLHLKRDPALRWLREKWGTDLLTPDPKKP